MLVRSRTAPRRMALPMVVVVGMVVLGQVTAATVEGARTAVFGLSLLLLDAVGAAYGARAARRSVMPNTWRLVTTARLLSLISTCTLAMRAATGDQHWWWSGVVAGLAMFGCLSLAAVSAYAPRLTARQYCALAMEALPVVAGGFMFAWYFVLRRVTDEDASPQWLFAIGFPLGNLLLLAAVSIVLLRGAAQRLADPVTILLAGMLMYAVSDLSFAAAYAHGQHATDDATATTCLVLASLLMTVAAIRQASIPADTAPQPQRPISAWSTYLPLAAVAVGSTFMLVTAILEGQFETRGVLVIAQTITTAALAVRQIISLRDSRDLNVVDPLTGLANLTGLREHVQRLDRRQSSYAMVLVDLDGFKRINDTHGHDLGNAVLTSVGRCLRTTIRRGDLAARVGGDEFVIVACDITDAEQGASLAKRVLAALSANPVKAGDDTVDVHASVGVALAEHSAGAAEVQRHADLAMYEAKRAGVHSWRLYDTSMTDRRGRDAAVAEALPHALPDGQLTVAYQPMVDLSTGRPVAVEALLRWQHPRLGNVSPLEFIPVAERTGVITDIGLWVLEQACRQTTAWRDAGHDLYASINVSPRQLQEPTFCADVFAILDRTGLPPQHLVLEVTESAVVEEQTAIPALMRLRSRGVRIAIDDFGTGYSSLHYLTRLPVDILKIDRSFVAELDGTVEGATVTEAVIRLAQALRLTTVAEGIETPEQATELQMLGCNTGQGYLFSPPVAAPELQHLEPLINRSAVP